MTILNETKMPRPNSSEFRGLKGDFGDA